MEGSRFLGWKKGSRNWLHNVEDDEELSAGSTLPSVPQPDTPRESMEFLSRSWSLSATEISKALAQKEKESAFLDQKLNPIHMHAALSVAGVAAALASVAAAENRKGSSTKMSTALASATELLASHCIELAESAGAEHDRVASMVRSAVDVRSASDLITLTAAAATALRGEAALKARSPKESKRNASITPCDKSLAETHPLPACHYENPEVPCVGDLLQLTRKGSFRSDVSEIQSFRKS